MCFACTRSIFAVGCIVIAPRWSSCCREIPDTQLVHMLPFNNEERVQEEWGIVCVDGLVIINTSQNMGRLLHLLNLLRVHLN